MHLFTIRSNIQELGTAKLGLWERRFPDDLYDRGLVSGWSGFALRKGTVVQNINDSVVHTLSLCLQLSFNPRTPTRLAI